MSNDDNPSRRKSRSNYTDDNRGKKKSHRQQRSSKSYKSDLDKLFQSGGKVPERFKGMMDTLAPEEGSPEAVRREALEEMRQADDLRTFAKAVNAYLRKGYDLPDDEELLGRMLDHPSERTVQKVLEHLLDFHRRQTLTGSASLKARLKTVKTVTDSPHIHELADKVQDAIR